MISSTQVYRPGDRHPLPAFAPGQLNVTFKGDMSAKELAAFQKKYDIEEMVEVDLGEFGTYYSARFDTGLEGMTATRDMRLRLSKDPRVASAELVPVRVPMRGV